MLSPILLYAVSGPRQPDRGGLRDGGGRRGNTSGVHVGQRLLRVIIVHEGLLDVEVRGQVVRVELHVRRHHFQRGEEKAADRAAVHERSGVRLQVADHGGAPSEEALADFALVGFLPGVDAEVVGELPRVGEAFTAVATPVPLPTDACCPDSPILPRVPVGQDPSGRAL